MEHLIIQCKQCGGEIDQRTIDFFHKIRSKHKKPYRNPSICGACFVEVIGGLLAEMEEKE